MVDLQDEELNKELGKLKKQKLPTLKEIKKENQELEKLEKGFGRKFLKKTKK